MIQAFDDDGDGEIDYNEFLVEIENPTQNLTHFSLWSAAAFSATRRQKSTSIWRSQPSPSARATSPLASSRRNLFSACAKASSDHLTAK